MAWTLRNLPDQSGRVAIVTGGNGGLGFQTARVLARRGATIVLAVRSEERGASARRAILAEVPDAAVEVVPLDLESLELVRAAAASIAAEHPRVDILVNNAGVMATPFRTTKDGHEFQLGVNHLGHFAFTAGLLSPLRASPDGRVVSVTSTGRFAGSTIDLDDPRMERRYNAWRAYGRAKLAALQFAIELDERLAAAGATVRSMAADPGYARTDLQARSVREEPGLGQRFFDAFVRRFGSSALRGALPQLRAATDPAAVGGALYGLRFVLRGDPVRISLVGPFLGPEARSRMWDASEQLTGTPFSVEAAVSRERAG